MMEDLSRAAGARLDGRANVALANPIAIADVHARLLPK